MGAHRLLTNCFERVAAVGLLFVAQQCLRPGRDIGERVVDLVAGPVGLLFHRVEFFLLELGVKVFRHKKEEFGVSC